MMSKKLKHYLKEMALRHCQKNETPAAVEDYIEQYGDKFYVYLDDGEVRGYCDYFVIGSQLYVYDFICEGDIFKMWKYGKKFMKDNGIKTIVFKRRGKDRKHGRNQVS